MAGKNTARWSKKIALQRRTIAHVETTQTKSAKKVQAEKREHHGDFTKEGLSSLLAFTTVTFEVILVS